MIHYKLKTTLQVLCCHLEKPLLNNGSFSSGMSKGPLLLWTCICFENELFVDFLGFVLNIFEGLLTSKLEVCVTLFYPLHELEVFN